MPGQQSKSCGSEVQGATHAHSICCDEATATHSHQWSTDSFNSHQRPLARQPIHADSMGSAMMLSGMEDQAGYIAGDYLFPVGFGDSVVVMRYDGSQAQQSQLCSNANLPCLHTKLSQVKSDE